MWMDLEICSVKEARQESPRLVCLHFYELSRIGKSVEMGGRLVVARGWGWGGRRGMESDCLIMNIGFLLEVIKMLWN